MNRSMEARAARKKRPSEEAKGTAPLKYKLFVFDLDETLWTVSEGLCNLIQPPFQLETENRLAGRGGRWVELLPGVRQMLEFLKQKNLYISLASRNDREPTLRLLEALGVSKYFDFPQLCWKPKGESIRKIIREIHKRDKVSIKPEEVLFIDDWPENIQAVRQEGMKALLFGQDVLSFEDLIRILS